MAFGRDALSVNTTVGSETYSFPFEGKLATYPTAIRPIVGITPWDGNNGPFVPYRREELIEGNVAETLSVTIKKGDVERIIYMMCASSKVATAVSTVKSGGNYASTSLWGKSTEYNGDTGWTIIRASKIKNIRVHD